MAQVYDLIITDHGIVRDTRTYVVVGLDVCCLNSSDVIRTFTMGKLQPMVNWLSIDINIPSPSLFLPPLLLLLQVCLKIQLGGPGKHCKLPQWGWGRAPAKIEFDAF